jgi:hypothetical protein
VRDLPSGCIGDVYVGVIEQQSSGAIKFNPRLLVRSLCRDEIRLARGERSGILQDCSLCGEADSQFLLIGIQRLTRQVDGGLRRLHGCPILTHIELRIANFDADLILQLL